MTTDAANVETVLNCIEALREALQMVGRKVDSLDALEYEYRNEFGTGVTDECTSWISEQGNRR